MVILIFTETETGGRPASVHVKTRGLALAAAVGVPVIIPMLAFSIKPAGNIPLLSVQFSGDVPPWMKLIRLYENGCPMVPACGWAGAGFTSANIGLTVT